MIIGGVDMSGKKCLADVKFDSRLRSFKLAKEYFDTQTILIEKELSKFNEYDWVVEWVEKGKLGNECEIVHKYETTNRIYYQIVNWGISHDPHYYVLVEEKRFSSET